MSEFGPEAVAVDWLHDRFARHEHLTHLRARRRGRVVTVESGPDDDPVAHLRFRRDTVHLWLLEMPARGGRWEGTPYRDTLEHLLGAVEERFPWALTPIASGDADGTSDPGY